MLVVARQPALQHQDPIGAFHDPPLDLGNEPGLRRADQNSEQTLPHRVDVTVTQSSGKVTRRELVLDNGVGGQTRNFRFDDVTKAASPSSPPTAPPGPSESPSPRSKFSARRTPASTDPCRLPKLSKATSEAWTGSSPVQASDVRTAGALPGRP